MEISRRKIILIIFWQGFLTSLWLPWWWVNSWSYPSGFDEILHNVMSIYGLTYVFIAFAGSFGLLLRRKWGIWLYFPSLGTAILFILWIFNYSTINFQVISWNVVIPIFIAIALAFLTTLSIVYLFRSQHTEISQIHSKKKFIDISKAFFSALGIHLWVVVILTIPLGIGFRSLDYIRDSNEIRFLINQTKTDLTYYQNLWNRNNITDYSFRLTVIYGGHQMWEGFGGISSGGEKAVEIIVEVRNGEVSSLKNADNSQLIEPTTSPYHETIPELFSLVQSVLDDELFNAINDLNNNTEDTEFQKIFQMFNTLPDSETYLAAADYNQEIGYPETISIYKQIGNSQSYLEIFYLISYQVSNFMDLQ